MKKKLTILSVLLLAFYSYSQHIKTPTFEISFPLEPKFEEVTTETDAGDSTIKMYQLRHLNSMILMMEGTIDEEYDFESIEEVTKASLQGARNGSNDNLALQLGTKATNTSEVFYQYKDKILALKSSDVIGPFFGNTFATIFQNKMYSIMVFSQTNEEGTTLYNNLLDSFKLVHLK
ncbi:hypothetical protein [Flavobacterium sp. UBA6135]|uniref:hypothetical protein n=1 Tax=Flavobacterium sp. UBA6135 TaxID=1946553 RepID=UPI0025BD399F|nr:hypothetical protein [Flavobacterium sp. UBA6135]